jgi:ATP-dependent phosphoenolpyruvate carboxykinase
VLQPHTQWADPAAFTSTLNHLAGLFVKAFSAYMDDAEVHVGEEMAHRILLGGPDATQLEGSSSSEEQ